MKLGIEFWIRLEIGKGKSHTVHSPLIRTFKGNRKKVRVIGSSNYRGQNHIENDPKGNENWFKLAGGSSYREFELPELIF